MDNSKRQTSRSGNTPQVRLSKSLSWLLRHGAVAEGFILSEGGFLYVDDILKHKTFRRNTVDDIKHVVATDTKQRYTLRHCPADPTRLQIRANQGHSLQVEDLELTPIVDASSIPVVIHGTYSEKMTAINNQGLSRMNRNHIHFFTAEPGSKQVISGARQDCDVFIYIDVEKAMRDGFEFYRSSNGVVLCPGNRHGIIPCEYFEKTVQKQ